MEKSMAWSPVEACDETEDQDSEDSDEYGDYDWYNANGLFDYYQQLWERANPEYRFINRRSHMEQQASGTDEGDFPAMG